MMSDVAIKAVPTQSILYDKIINVTLVWSDKVNDVDATIIPNDPNNDGQQKTIYRMPGDIHYVWDKRAGQSYKYVATGNILRYQFANPTHLKNFTNGWTPDGERVLSDGDRLLTIEGSIQKTYHIMTSQPSTVYEQGRLEIPCSMSGMKPDISFGVKALPGNNCYQLTLKITGLCLGIDIRQVAFVTVEAGYRGEQGQPALTQTFFCPVFSSYLESPGPDSISVFNCICTGTSSTNLLLNKPICINYRGGKVKVSALINAIGRALTQDKTVYNLLSDYYNNIEIEEDRLVTKYYTTGASLLNDLRQILEATIQHIENQTHISQYTSLMDAQRGPAQISVQIYNGQLIVFAVNRKNIEVKDLDVRNLGVVPLNAVKGATFNGVALTVKSVWNPQLSPGDVFEMSPYAINGSNLPNLLDESTFRGTGQERDRYRVLTMSIQFGTVQDINEMEITAIPLKYSEQDNKEVSQMSQFLSFEKAAGIAAQQYQHVQSITIDLGNGTTGMVQTPATAAGKDQEFQQKVNKMLGQVPTNSVSVSTGLYTVIAGDSLSRIADNYYSIQSNLLPKSRDYMIKYNSLWPLISCETYNEHTKLINAGQNSNYLNAEMVANPNLIRVGKYAKVPLFTDWSQLKQMQKIFEYAIDAYSMFPDYEAWVQSWKSLLKAIQDGAE